MSDPIRIPVLPREDNYGDCSYDYVRIDPDLARRIVELAKADAQPVADDEAVQAIVEGMRTNTGTMHGMAIGALAVIKSGKVPGVCCDNDPNALSRRLAADLAVCRAELDRARRMANATWADMQAAGGLCGQRDDEYPLQAVQRFVRDAASDDLAAQRDRLAGLLADAMPMTYGIAGPEFLKRVTAALAELNPPTPTAPTNGEGGVK